MEIYRVSSSYQREGSSSSCLQRCHEILTRYCVLHLTLATLAIAQRESHISVLSSISVSDIFQTASDIFQTSICSAVEMSSMWTSLTTWTMGFRRSKKIDIFPNGIHTAICNCKIMMQVLLSQSLFIVSQV